MALLLMGYFYFFAPKPGDLPQGGAVDTVHSITQQESQLRPDTIQHPETRCPQEANGNRYQTANLQAEYGIFTKSPFRVMKKIITIEND
jgi:hypothetical protein